MSGARVCGAVLGAMALTSAVPAQKTDHIQRGAGVIVYPVPDAVADSPYEVTVNDQSVPIEQAGHVERVYYARFQVENTGHIHVRFRGRANARAELRAARPSDSFSGARDWAHWIMKSPGPGVLIVEGEEAGLPRLLLIADKCNPGAHPLYAGRVVTMHADDANADRLRTQEIQQALDRCAAAPGGGIVYFEPGVYRTGTIRVGDSTTVYLAPGALIVGSDDPDDYPQGPNGRQLILFDGCSHSSLRGCGVVDGSGHILRMQKDTKAHLLDVIGCRDIAIEDVVLRNPAAWCVHILGCEDVRVDRLKVINDWGVPNTDGVNPDCSSGVRITHYFGHCGDDAIAVKTTLRAGFNQPTRDVQVRECLVMTKKTGLKLGTESRADISDVLFENVGVIGSSRGIGLWMRDGATFSNIVFRDIVLDLREFEGEEKSGEPIRAVIQERKGIGKIEDVLFERVQCRGPYRSILAGMPESRLRGFTFRECVFEPTRRTIKMEPKPVIELAHAQGFAFDRATVRWVAEQPEVWAGLLRQTECEDVRAEGLREAP